MSGIVFWISVLVIVYVYAGYPLLVFLLSFLQGRKINHPSVTPSITLLVSAYYEETVIGAKMENCLSLDYPREKLQILVAVDGSEDRTAEIVRSFSDKGVELIWSSTRRGKIAAINNAMKYARNEIVVFSDANNQYLPDTIRELVRPFADPSVGAVSGSKMVGFKEGNIRLGQAESLYWRYESFLKERESRVGCCIGVAGEILAIRRELFIPPPERIINEDFYLALQVMKQGFNVVYAPRARSVEIASTDPREELIRKTRIVAGRYQIMGFSLPLLPFRRPLVVWQIISHKYLRPLVPLFMITALLANVFALLVGVTGPGNPWIALRSPASEVLLAVQLAFYLLAVLGNSVKSTGWLGRILYLPTYLVVSNYAALLGLIRYFSGRQTALWKKVQR
jgi:biofilm PGA synthesis N-glycosyltransferase PgaC